MLRISPGVLSGRIQKSSRSASRAASSSRFMASMSSSDTLVSAQWLSERMKDKTGPKISILDCSWYMPAAQRNIQKEFEAQRIPGAQLFDIDKISDKSQNLPHMLPSPMQFERQVSELGVSNDDHIVLYDQSGIYFASARAWWTFRVFGHDKVSVLQGGFQKWKESGLQIVSGPAAAAAPGRFIVKEFRRNLVKSMDEMRDNINSKRYQVVDARPERRFTAQDPEPRPQLLGGHIPGSNSLEFGKVIDRSKGDFLEKEALSQIWQQARTDLSKPVVATCGSGVSASVLALSAHLLGNSDVAVYDGSWSEWGLPENNNPIAK